MMLNALAVQNAKPRATPYKMGDGDGLYLLVQPTGAKYWRFNYRFDGKEKTLALGVFSNFKEGRKVAPILISLSDARAKRDDARRLLANGIDPAEYKKQTKTMAADRASNTFEAVGREWIAKFSPSWSDSHANATTRILERDFLPWVGATPIHEVTATDVLACLERIAKRGAVNAAHRARVVAGQVFRFGIATGRCNVDISAGLRGALATVKGGHHAAIVDPTKLAIVLRAIDAYPGSMAVMCALKLLPMLLVRPTELRMMEWSEVDIETATWSIPADRMKMENDHIVPLPTQAVAILREIHPLTGRAKYVFSGTRSRGLSIADRALTGAMTSMGFGGVQTPHGFRATARTILDEVLKVRVDLIEHQLAHAVKDSNGRAYNRTSFLPERREMLQTWADYLDELKRGAEVLPFHQRQA